MVGVGGSKVDVAASLDQQGVGQVSIRLRPRS